VVPTPEAGDVRAPGRGVEPYRPVARVLHWLTVLLIAVQVPAGIYMVYRGPGQKIWDALTNALYSGHKLIGLIILAVVLVRLVYRLMRGAPAHEPTLTTVQRVVSALNHWGMYVLLLIVPLLGYVAICYFPALTIFGVISLPAVVEPDKSMYRKVIELHGNGAFALAALIGLHLLAALYHHFIRRDGVLARMLPSLRRRG
jgi:cytochrome b561